MDTTGLLMGALLLAAGIAIGVLLGRAHPRERHAVTRLDALLEPASDAMQRVEQHLHEVERDRAAAYSGLREQVSALHRTSADLNQHTRALAGALSAPQVRGRWGELQLQRVVELAGMVEHCDFDTQVGVRSDDPEAAGVRPDMIIRLSGGRQIPVDAKVPFAAYLEAVDCPDQRRRAALLAAHARALRGHVDALSAKAYWRHFQPAPEFVVLFVPGEPLLDAALSADPGLADYAFGRNVVMATPTSLIALLRTVAHVWRQERLSASAAQVHELGRDLHHRLGVLASHLSTLGASLDKAVRSYNGTVRSLESRVLVTARKLADLGVTGEELPRPAQVDTAPLIPQESASFRPADPLEAATDAAAAAAVQREAAESTYGPRGNSPPLRSRDATVDR
ncbi:MAG TPA: DNA recombination protein RmuC [Nakamurella sp.]